MEEFSLEELIALTKVHEDCFDNSTYTKQLKMLEEIAITKARFGKNEMIINLPSRTKHQIVSEMERIGMVSKRIEGRTYKFTWDV